MNLQHSLWPLRILSVAIAVVLWLLYSYSGREVNRQELAFDEVNVTYSRHEGVVLLNPTSVVSVRLSGPAELMADLSPFQVSVSVDIAPEPGLQELVLTGDMVSRPPGIDVVSISPSRLSIEVDEEIRKELRVRVARGGSEPSAGARWLEQATYALPRTILFRGPKSILEERDEIFVYIDLQNRVTSFEIERSVEPIHELVQPVGPSIVTVFVAMEPAELPSLGSR